MEEIKIDEIVTSSDVQTATERNIDIVFCIDGTGSMSPIIETVKKNVAKFKEQLTTALAENNNVVKQLRTKIIVFRDYGYDEDAMEFFPANGFYDLSKGADEADWEKAVNGIDAHKGGDIPENGLEALYYAMTQDFTCKAKDRQIIVMFTDADALPLKERASADGYPAEMAENFDELQNIWNGSYSKLQLSLGQRQKRMVVYAPAGTVYEDMAAIFNQMQYVTVDAKSGLEEIDFSVIINDLVRSVA